MQLGIAKSKKAMQRGILFEILIKKTKLKPLRMGGKL